MNNVFSGKWITAQEFSSGETDLKNFYMKVKKAFTINELKTASIKISADDYYKLYINGKYAGQGPAPGYTFAYNYNEFDITDFLINGENEITVMVYYQGLINRVFVSGDSRQGMIADIYLGNEFAFGTDASWIYCIDNSFIGNRTTGYDTAFLEDRDFRIQDSSYKHCVEVNADYHFSPEPFPALTVYPVYARPVQKGNRYFYDLKQEYAGSLKIKASSKAPGAKLIIRCGEETDNDNNVRFNLRCSCCYEETCILNSGENIIEQFDYKAFRYVEILADDGVVVDEVQMLVRHYPFPKNALEIKTSDTVLQSVFTLCKNTIKYGTQEVFVDCPTREKGQYAGDVFISGFAHLYLTGDARMLKKAMENISQSITYCGEILAVSPCSLQQKIADYALLFPLMLRKYYHRTGDKDFLQKMLPTCEYITDYFSSFEGSDGLLNTVDSQWNLVDWPENCRDDYNFPLTEPIGPGCHNVINAFYISSVENTEKIKEELHIPCKNKSSQLKSSFHKAFFNNGTGLYADCGNSSHSSIHSVMLPIVFDICPAECLENAADYLISRGMCCGTYMSYFYLKALCKADRKQDAYNTITSKSENSWYHMISEGATTCFEAWGKEKKWNTSLFHPWSTAPILILYEHFPDMLDGIHMQNPCANT